MGQYHGCNIAATRETSGMPGRANRSRLLIKTKSRGRRGDLLLAGRACLVRFCATRRLHRRAADREIWDAGVPCIDSTASRWCRSWAVWWSWRRSESLQRSEHDVCTVRCRLRLRVPACRRLYHMICTIARRWYSASMHTVTLEVLETVFKSRYAWDEAQDLSSFLAKTKPPQSYPNC
jgi:hypothetical protein